MLASAWFVLFVYAFPGIMSPDTFEHLNEGRAGFYTDGHPPTMDLLFAVCDQIVAGGFAVFILESTLFLLGLYLVLRRTFPRERAAWIAAALGVFPPIMLPMAAVWKDSLMASCLLLGIAGLLDARRGAKLAALGALFVANAVRYNAFGATVPLIFLLFTWQPGVHWLKRYALSAAIAFALMLAAFRLNSALVDQPMHYWHSSLGVHDIAGTLAHVDATIPDAELEQLFAGTDLRVHAGIHARIKKLYTPKTYVMLDSMYEPEALWNLPLYGTTPAPEAQRDALERAWKTTITRYPGAYVRHRLAVMQEVLSFSRKRPIGVVPLRDFPYPQTVVDSGLTITWSPLQLAWTRGLVQLNRWTPLFEPWMYLAIALLLLPLTRGHRDVFALYASGIVIESSLLLIAPSPDYRYSHWMILASVLGTVVLYARRKRGQGQLAQLSSRNAAKIQERTGTGSTSATSAATVAESCAS